MVWTIVQILCQFSNLELFSNNVQAQGQPFILDSSFSAVSNLEKFGGAFALCAVCVTLRNMHVDHYHTNKSSSSASLDAVPQDDNLLRRKCRIHHIYV